MACRKWSLVVSILPVRSQACLIFNDSPQADPAMTPRLAAALVHVFTASGIACAFFATQALMASDWRGMFAWLGLALIVDAVDGPLARRFKVKSVLPRFDGERLDLIIDYITYVFIAALALLGAGFLVGMPGQILAVGILMSSLFHFCDTQSKTEDNCFVGFPAIWNVVAFYMFAFAPPAWVAMTVVAVCIAATFYPLKWVHPVRVVKGRRVTAAVGAAWAVAAVVVVVQGFPGGGVARAVLAGCGVYAVVLSLWLGRARGD